MNEHIIPPTVNRFKNSVVACSPDNTLVYGACNFLVILKPMPPKSPPQVTLKALETTRYIASVCINRKWDKPEKHIAAMDEIGQMFFYNLSQGKMFYFNAQFKSPAVGIVFAGEDRLVAVSQKGVILIWNITKSETTELTDLLIERSDVSCISSCPHDNSLVAFGYHSGLITVADLRRKGTVRFKLLGHTKEVTGFSWCPVPVNVFPLQPNNTVGQKVKTESSLHTAKPRTEHPWVTEYKKASGNEEVDEIRTFPELFDPSDNIFDSSGAFEPNELVPCVEGVLEDLDTNIKVDEVEKDFLTECNDLRNKILANMEDQDEDQNTKPDQNDSLMACSKSDVDEMANTESTSETITVASVQEACEQQDCPNATSLVATTESENVETLNVKEEEQFTKDENERVGSDVLNEIMTEVTSNVKQESDNMPTDTGNSDAVLIENIPDECSLKTDNASTSGVAIMNDTQQLDDSHECNIVHNVNGLVDVHKSAHIGNDLIHSDSQTKTHDGDNTSVNGRTNNADISTEYFYDCLSDERYVSYDNIKEETNHTDVSKGETVSTERSIVVSIEEEPRDDYLLASISRDKNVYVWRAGSDGRMQTMYKYTKPKYVKDYSRYQNHNDWTAICWLAPSCILTAFATGEVHKLAVPKRKSYNWKSFELVKKHPYTIMNICAPVEKYTKCDWKQFKDLSYWTLFTQGTISHELLGKNKKQTICMSTLTHTVNNLNQSPLDPSLILLGGNNALFTWNMSAPTKQGTILNFFHCKNYGKITCANWHPVKETMLTFGTDCGLVGILEYLKIRKFPHYFREAVHNVQWGPYFSAELDMEQMRVYATADGTLAIFDVYNMNRDPLVLSQFEKSNISHFSWKPDYSALLVSLRDGRLILYDRKLTQLRAVYAHEKGFNSMRWHPDASCSETEKSTFCNYFAVTVPSKGLVIYNMKNVSLDESGDDQQSMVDRTLMLRDGFVSCISWNPFGGEKLAALTLKSIQILDIKNEEVLLKFRYNPAITYISSILWSPLDSNFIMTSGKSVNIIDITETFVPYDEKDEKADSIEEPGMFYTINNNKGAASKKQNDYQRKVVKQTLMHDVNKFEFDFCKQETFLKTLSEHLCSDDKNALIEEPCLQIFGSHNDVLAMVDRLEKNCHQSDQLTYLSLCKGDLSKRIKHAIEHREVTPRMLSWAPYISQAIWSEACETLADQMSEEVLSNPLEVAGYYLACHKIEKAFHFLCSTDNYADALMLAKCRLPEDSLVFADILTKWAQYAESNGSFELAAKCYLALGDHRKAAHVLLRRNNDTILNVAQEFATQAQADNLAQFIAEKRLHLVQFKDSPVMLEPAPIENSTESLPQLDDIIDKNMGDNSIEQAHETSTGTLATGADGDVKELRPIADVIIESMATKNNIEELDKALKDLSVDQQCNGHA